MVENKMSDNSRIQKKRKEKLQPGKQKLPKYVFKEFDVGNWLYGKEKMRPSRKWETIQRLAIEKSQ